MKTSAIALATALATIHGAERLYSQADTLGYVALIHGSWHLDPGGTGLLLGLSKGSIVYGGMLLVPPRGASASDMIQIITMNSERIVRLCGSPRDCDEPYRLPRSPASPGAITRVSTWVQRTIRNLFARPQQWETLAARGSSFRDGVLLLTPDELNWRPIIGGSNPPRYLRLVPIVVNSQPQRPGAPMTVTVNSAGVTTVHQQLAPGLYRVQIPQRATDAWVLLSSPATFLEDSAAHAYLVEKTQTWGSTAVADSLARSVLRAGLYTIVEGRVP